MIRRREKDNQRFQVSCIWCGSKIREDKEHDSTGVCL